jgi:hypothetical protein
MINPFNATTEVRNILIADKTIKSFVGNKIYPLIAPDGTSGDFIVYQRDGNSESESKMGVSDIEATVFIIIVSDNYKHSQDMAMAAYKCLDGTYSGDIREIRLQDSTEDLADRKYYQILKFKIK